MIQGKLSYKFLVLFIINAAILYESSLLFPNSIVLGNANVSPFAATVLTSLALTLLDHYGLEEIRKRKLFKLNKNTKFFVTAALNIVVIWILSRLALVFGFGISYWAVALLMGIVLAVPDYLVEEMSVFKAK